MYPLVVATSSKSPNNKPQASCKIHQESCNWVWSEISTVQFIPTLVSATNCCSSWSSRIRFPINQTNKNPSYEVGSFHWRRLPVSLTLKTFCHHWNPTHCRKIARNGLQQKPHYYSWRTFLSHSRLWKSATSQEEASSSPVLTDSKWPCWSQWKLVCAWVS